MRRGEPAGNWSRRYKANLEKMASGDPAKVAEVVHDLEVRERETGLTAGESRLLERAHRLWGALHDQSPATAADRESAIDLLLAVFAEGRLDQGQYGDRYARLQAARTRGEIQAELIDLQQ